VEVELDPASVGTEKLFAPFCVFPFSVNGIGDLAPGLLTTPVAGFLVKRLERDGVTVASEKASFTLIFLLWN